MGLERTFWKTENTDKVMNNVEKDIGKEREKKDKDCIGRVKR